MSWPSEWRREALRTNLWFVPTLLIALAVGMFAGTYALDRAAYDGSWHLPSFVIGGDADAAREILTGSAAAVITVVTLVFSITIVTLTLASTQFGPRMLGNFIRDRITQVTLGSFVGTFVYAILVLATVGISGAHGEFVPHISLTVTMLLLILDVGVLVLFIDHIARSIQLPQVIAGIARDLSQAIRSERVSPQGQLEAGPSLEELLMRLESDSAPLRAPRSGYLQYVSIPSLVDVASRTGAVIRLLHRPGHFVVEGEPFGEVWPPNAAARVSRAIGGAHATGPHRTLTQDPAFAVDQLVEIAIRALSAAVNDTFTALACIDWLSDGLGKLAADWEPPSVHRDGQGHTRLITVPVSFQRLLQRAHDKIRQASRGMPAVMIRQLDGLGTVMRRAERAEQRRLLLEEAQMVLRLSEESVPEEADRADVRRAYESVVAAAERRQLP